MPRRTHVPMVALGVGIGLMLAAFALYAPSIGYDFINLDDMHYIVDNPRVSGGFSWEALKAAWTTAPADCWAPLLWMSFMLDVELFGLESWGFHLINVLLFSLSAGIWFGVVWRWTGRTGLALAAAALWTFHPSRVESVVWVVERKDVLSGFFFLLCLWAYVRGREGGRLPGGWTWVSAGFLLLGMLAKPVLVMVPFVLLLLDAWPLGRVPWGGRALFRELPTLIAEKWPYGLVAFGIGAIAWWAGPATPQPSWSYRLATIPINYSTYLRQTVWPVGLSVLCPRPGFSIALLGLSLVVLGGVTAWTWSQRRRHPAIVVGWLWFGIMLIPSIGFFWFGTTEGNGVRFSYLPHMGLMLAGVAGADAFIRWRGWPWRRATVGCVLLAVIWGGMTASLMTHWSGNRKLYARVLQINPNSAHAFEGLGNACYEEGRLAEWQAFLENFRRTWSKNPIVDIHYAWWKAAVLGRTDASVEVLEQLTGLDSSDSDFWTWVDQRTNGEQLLGSWRDTAAICLRQKGDLERMENLQTIWKDGWDERTRKNYLCELQTAYWLAGRDAEAAMLGRELEEESRAIGLADLIQERFQSRWRQGARGYAFEGFVALAQRRRADGMALNNMAWLVATAEPDGLDHARMEEWPATAVAWAEAAIELGGEEFAGAWDTLAAARANAGDFEGAVAAAERAMDLAKRSGEWALADKVQRRLDGYRSGRPWREEDERVQKRKGR